MRCNLSARFSISVLVALGIFWGCSSPGAQASSIYLAKIDIPSVSPRDVATTGTDVLDSVASGLRNIGVGQKIYFNAAPLVTSGIGGYNWTVSSRPTGSTVSISATTGTLVFLRPDLVGDYTVTLTPLNASHVATPSTSTLVIAGTWVGTGTINTHQTPDPNIPNCGATWCHGGENADPRLAKLLPWQSSLHATKLERTLDGEVPGTYKTSCLPCHTVGNDSNASAINGGFDDVAAQIGFDVNQIPVWVADALTTNTHKNFELLPAPLQNLSNIQCENCHGAGSRHFPRMSQPDHGISGVDLSGKSCRACHDSGNSHIKVIQWSQSGHALINTLTDPASSGTCAKCHSGEGFVNQRVKHLAAAPVMNSNPATCPTCHDPHGSPNEHQLRLADTFTFDSGQTITGAGMGALCMNCHNSRMTSAATGWASSRGSHNGPQGDVLYGLNGVDFGTPLAPNSAHTTAVPDTCVTCHMAPKTVVSATAPKVGDHTWSMRDTMGTTDTSDDVINAANACGGCHTGITTYDIPAGGDYDGDGVVEGVQTEVRGLLSLLYNGPTGTTGIHTWTGVTLGSYGQLSITTAGFNALTTAKKQAFYNYNLIYKDRSFGIHNTSFAVQILQRSYFGVYGHAITVDYPGIAKRDSVVTHTLTYIAGAYGSISGTTPQTVADGGVGAAVTAVPATGHHFVTWSDAVLTATRQDVGVTANISVTASFTTNTYTLTYAAGAHGSITGPSPQTVNYGGSGTAVTAVPATGYHFVAWSDASTINPRTDLNVAANASLTANFVIDNFNTYTLTYTAGAHGMVSGASPQTVNAGATGSPVTAIAASGYHFVNWSDASTVNPRIDANVLANIGVTANFALNTYTLTYRAAAHGTVSGTLSQTVTNGANGTTVTAVSATGYHFAKWSDGVLTASRRDMNVTANVSVTAYFVITLTYAAGPNGAISGISAQTVTYGASGTPVTAVPAAGFRFTKWSDGLLTASRTDKKVTASIAVTASFARDSRILSLSGDLAFGTLKAGSSAQRTLRIANTGASELHVSGIVYPKGFSGAWSGTIAAGGSHDVVVTFAATAQASYGGTVTVKSDKTAGTDTVSCSGKCVGVSLASPLAVKM